MPLKDPLKDFIFNLYIDYKTKFPKMWMTKGDTNGNRLIITLINKEGVKDKAVSLVDVASVSLVFSKEDGNVVVGDTTIIDAPNGTIEYIVKGNEIAFIGEVLVEVQVYGADSRYTTSQFVFEVRGSLDNGTAILSTTEYPILISLINSISSFPGAEVLRVTAEDGRAAADSLRQTNTTTATQNANTATNAANVATSAANTATGNASTAASSANVAKSAADTAALSANTAAETANTVIINTNLVKDETILAIQNTNTATLSANNSADAANIATGLATTATTSANLATGAAATATGLANTATSEANAVKSALQGYLDNPEQFKGDTGLSAYEIWLSQGNIGTEAVYIASLKGVQGDTGIQGVQGVQGTQGAQGLTGLTGVKGGTGAQGTQGISGIATATSGLFALNVDGSGHLIVSYPDSAPDFSLDGSGHLIYTF